MLPTILLAAGLGTRLLPFTKTCPKAFLPVLGSPLLAYLLEGLQAWGVPRAVMNLHAHREWAKGALSELLLEPSLAYWQDRLQVSEEPTLLGSGGGLRQAYQRLAPVQGPFLVVNADMVSSVWHPGYWDFFWKTHQTLRQTEGVWGTLGLLPSSPSGEAYTEIQWHPTKAGLIQGLGPKSTQGPLFMSAAILEPELWERLEFPEGAFEWSPRFFQPACRANRLGGCLFPKSMLWLDIGTPSVWQEAHFQLLELFEHNSSQLLPSWKRRITTHCRRWKPAGWTSQHVSSPPPASFKTPFFWSPPINPSPSLALNLGPRAVLYGSPPTNSLALQEGIGWNQEWVATSLKNFTQGSRAN